MQGVGYLAIVSSGTDINTIHYFSDRHKIEPNQLVVLDFAASLDHMTMDITRTFNIKRKVPARASQVVRRRTRSAENNHQHCLGLRPHVR